MTVGEKIKALRKEKGISADKLAELIGKDRATIYRYESRDIEKLPTNVIEPLAKALGTTPAFLMGWEAAAPPAQGNIVMLPLYGSASAGFGMSEDKSIIQYIPTYIDAPSEQEQYVWIRVQGDSMSPLIDDGSEILIKKQETVESGKIGVALIDGKDVVIKRICHGEGFVELRSVNPYYPPLRFEQQERRRVQILGIVKKISKTLQ